MAESKGEETFVESLLKAIGNTKSTTDLVFNNLELGINSIKTKVTLNGKVSIEVRPLHE
jgi:hypothetical protein